MSIPAVTEFVTQTPRMRQLMVSELRPSLVAVAWYAANGHPISEIVEKTGKARLTIESQLRDVRNHLGLNRTVDVRSFHSELKARMELLEAGAVEPGLLTPKEVAKLFRVDPKTVTRWAAAGRISAIRTPGGHRRFREAEVRALLAGDDAQADAGGDAA